MSIYEGKSSLGILLKSYIHVKDVSTQFCTICAFMTEIWFSFDDTLLIWFFFVKFTAHENSTFKLTTIKNKTKKKGGGSKRKNKLKIITLKILIKRNFGGIFTIWWAHISTYIEVVPAL